MTELAVNVVASLFGFALLFSALGVAMIALLTLVDPSSRADRLHQKTFTGRLRLLFSRA